MINFLVELWRQLHPPHLSQETLNTAIDTANQITKEAAKTERKFEAIANTAVATGKDPWKVMVHEVKGASQRKYIREGGN